MTELSSGRIRRAYDRAIKRAQKNEESPDLGKELSKRRDRLLEYTGTMTNLQYLERFLSYFYDETTYIWDYMTDPQIMIDDPSRILETIEANAMERHSEIVGILESGRGIREDFAALSDQEDFFGIYRMAAEKGIDCTIFTPFVMTIKGGKDSAEGPFLHELRQVQTRQMPQYDGHMDQLRADLEGYIARGFDVQIVCSTEERRKNMLEFVQHETFNERVLPGRYEAGHVQVTEGVITAGMELTDRKLCYIWEGDIFGGSKRRRKRSRSVRSGNPIKSFADVQKGDYVVHESHGIGKFTGIQQLIVQGMKQDFLKVEYAGTDMLYIPVDQLDSLQKYIGGDGITPRLNKLSGTEWKATKARAQAAVSDLAEELIRVANVRRNRGGYAFAEDTPWQKEFEDSFPYTETDDQLRCVSEIKEDMEKPYPMDRLLCGDVGFGKTEVAARALFKCVIEGKQAAVLVPTTLLANQHYYTLKERFEKFPVRVEMLSRFRTPTQQKKIIKDIGKGDVDLVIGTHRLLSKDMKFHDLGLLVIDEEQRFGVRHKERIKQLRENVDVLTLSATPIPRTLHMSLSGMKDMSTIEEPPEGRYPVQTYVMEEDSFLIREAIEKELARGGQVYVLSNRVKSINTVAHTIQELVPHASVAVGHGQMKEAELENIIMDFAAGEYDILVSTTIIESGTDIPNVNTMIVLDADRFGPAARKAYLALVKKLDAHANLADVCEGTVKKNDRDHYLARPRVNGAPYGQAALMWICNALLADAAVKTPATSKFFEKFTDPKSGVVSYLIKPGIESFQQQSLYYSVKSLTDDGRFLVFDVYDGEQECDDPNPGKSKQFAIIDFATDKMMRFPKTGGEKHQIPFLDVKTDTLYYSRGSDEGDRHVPAPARTARHRICAGLVHAPHDERRPHEGVPRDAHHRGDEGPHAAAPQGQAPDALDPGHARRHERPMAPVDRDGLARQPRRAQPDGREPRVLRVGQLSGSLQPAPQGGAEAGRGVQRTLPQHVLRASGRHAAALRPRSHPPRHAPDVDRGRQGAVLVLARHERQALGRVHDRSRDDEAVVLRAGAGDARDGHGGEGRHHLRLAARTMGTRQRLGNGVLQLCDEAAGVHPFRPPADRRHPQQEVLEPPSRSASAVRDERAVHRKLLQLRRAAPHDRLHHADPSALEDDRPMSREAFGAPRSSGSSPGSSSPGSSHSSWRWNAMAALMNYSVTRLVSKVAEAGDRRRKDAEFKAETGC